MQATCVIEFNDIKNGFVRIDLDSEIDFLIFPTQLHVQRSSWLVIIDDDFHSCRDWKTGVLAGDEKTILHFNTLLLSSY